MSSGSTPPVAAIILCAGKGTRFGELMKISHASETPRAVTDAVLDDLAARNVDYADAVGAYGCSTPRPCWMFSRVSSTRRSARNLPLSSVRPRVAPPYFGNHTHDIAELW